MPRCLPSTAPWPSSRATTPQPAQPPSARTIEKAVAWEIEDEIAAKTGRARFGPLQALAGDLDALEESIKEVDAWLAKNVDDLVGVDAAVRDVSDDTKTNEVVTENLEALDRVLAKIVSTAPQGLSLHPRAEKALRLRSVDRDVTSGRGPIKGGAEERLCPSERTTPIKVERSVREQKHDLDRVRAVRPGRIKISVEAPLECFYAAGFCREGRRRPRSRGETHCYVDGAAHARVLKDASLKTLCGALARYKSLELL